jgi:surface carbohydrate biosynthesis protein
MGISIKRVSQMLSYFIKSRKVWTLPKKSDVLIYDFAGYKIISFYINTLKSEILYTRNESINLHILFRSFFRRGEWIREYIYCYIEYVNPKIILTHIDNNRKFYLISSRYKSIKTIFLQNGVRGFYLDVFEILEIEKNKSLDYQVDYMFTFGNIISLEYKKYITGEFCNIGSVKNNYVKKSIFEKKRGSLLFISQYRDDKNLLINGKSMSRERYFESSDNFVLLFLIKYASDNNKDLKVITYNKKDSVSNLKSEMDYYNNLTKSPMSFLIRDEDESSYHACDEADVIVSIDSTLAYESAARGNKTAFFSIRGYFTKLVGMTFGWPSVKPISGKFWSSIPDEILFREILDYLFQIDEIEWDNVLKSNNFNDLMFYDPGNNIFIKKIDSLLK